MPLAERSGDLRASQKIINLPAVLVVIGGQQVEHIVASMAAQQVRLPLVTRPAVGGSIADKPTWPSTQQQRLRRPILFRLLPAETHLGHIR